MSLPVVHVGVDRDGARVAVSARGDRTGFTFQMSVRGAAALAANLTMATTEAGEGEWSSGFDLAGDLEVTRKAE